METKDTALLMKLRGLFAIEAEEHAQAITTSLLALEQQPESAAQSEEVETLYREVHTLKGAARAVNIGEVEGICQVVESLCAALKRREFGVWPELFDTLHRAMDVVRQLSGTPEGEGAVSVGSLVTELSQLEAYGRTRAVMPLPPIVTAQSKEEPSFLPDCPERKDAPLYEEPGKEDEKPDDLLMKLRGLFAIEAEEHAQAITTSLLALEQQPESAAQSEEVETLYREVHTLKGAARAVNSGEVEGICQVVESLCAALKRKEFGVWPELFDTLHRAMDVVRQLSGTSEGEGAVSVGSLVTELSQLEAYGRTRAADHIENITSPTETNDLSPASSEVVALVASPESAPSEMQYDESLAILQPAPAEVEDSSLAVAPVEKPAEQPSASDKKPRRRSAATTKKSSPRRSRTVEKKRAEPAVVMTGDNLAAVASHDQDQQTSEISSVFSPQLSGSTSTAVEAPHTGQGDLGNGVEPTTEAHAPHEMLERLRGLFALEAEEHLQVITDTLLTLEQDREQSATPVETLFRRIHTLKGASRAVNCREVETVCQAVENLCAALKRKELGVWPGFFDAMHRILDVVRQLCVAPEGPASQQLAEVLEEIRQLEAQGRECVQAAPETSSLLPAQEELVIGLEVPPFSGVDIQEKQTEQARDQSEALRADFERESHAVQVERVETVADTPLTATIRKNAAVKALVGQPKKSLTQEKGGGAQKPSLSTETVRIEASKLDALFLQAEEMLAVKLKTSAHATALHDLGAMLQAWTREWGRVHTDIRKTQRLLELETNRTSLDPVYIQATKLVQFLDWTHTHLKGVDQALTRVTRTMTQDQQALGSMVDILLADAKKVLMLPFASTFEVLPKMVRDLSRAQGKDVDFSIHGGEVEIDKRILEDIKDPLIHLLRNCIDHGLETAAERERQQKPARGSLAIAIASGDGNSVEITVTDDGSGIDVEKVKAAAVKCGILSQSAAEQLADHDAIALIFQSEVSTSSTVSDLSGRGLGMAIVREKVEKLGGQIIVETQRHHGSAFRIRLPLTLATFRGILVQVAGQTLVAPTANVERVVRVKRHDIRAVGNKETLVLAGYEIPLVQLDRVLGLTPKKRTEEPERVQIALVVGQNEQQIAFGVDTVMDEQEVLFKGLGRQLLRVRNIAGATVLGSGQVVPILHLSDLMSYVGSSPVALTKAVEEEPELASRKKSILVAEDSITSRMLLKEILEASEYIVTTAIDGEDAFASLQKAQFDLVVSDVEMPRLNGFDLASKIRKDNRYVRLPVVLVTGLESPADRQRGVDAGASAYVVKGSFDQSNLLETIRRLI